MCVCVCSLAICSSSLLLKVSILLSSLAFGGTKVLMPAKVRASDLLALFWEAVCGPEMPAVALDRSQHPWHHHHAASRWKACFTYLVHISYSICIWRITQIPRHDDLLAQHDVSVKWMSTFSFHSGRLQSSTFRLSNWIWGLDIFTLLLLKVKRLLPGVLSPLN